MTDQDQISTQPVNGEVVERAQPAPTVEHHTTIIREGGSGGGSGWMIFLVIIIALGVGGFYLMNQTRQSDSVTQAAEKVGGAAEKVGNAAEKAADKLTGNK